jgi:hypothetical protein
LPSRISCWYLRVRVGNLRWMKLLLAALVLPTAIVLAIAAFETQVFYPPPSKGQTTGVVWHGHTFTARADFARWLRSRGVRYAVWARRHPSLVGLRSRRLTHPPGRRTAQPPRARQRSSGWGIEMLGGSIAVLAGLGLVVLLVSRRRHGAGAVRVAALASRRRRGSNGGSVRQTLEPVRRRAVPAARGGGRLILRGATAGALLFSSLAASSAETIRRRRSEFAWYLATALLAVGVGVIATVWLNGV